MTLPNGSASAAERTIACPSWLALPHVHTSSDDATRGTSCHAFVRAILAGVALETALPKVDEEYRETCRNLDWHKLCGDLKDIETEVAYAVDVRARTARVLGVNIGRDYKRAAEASGQPLGEWEVPGSLDITGRSKLTGVRVVDDMKFGFQDIEAEDNSQGLFFAAVFSLLDGAEEIVFRISKVRPSGDVWKETATFRAWEVDEYLDRLEGGIERAKESRRVYLAGGVPEFSEGAWCRYCDSATACPAKTRLARAMLDELAPIEQAIETMPDEQAGRAYVLANQRVKPMLERILEALKDRARRAPFLLPDGKVLREAPYEQEKLDTQAALDLARQLGATDEQIRACYRETTIRPVKPCKVPGPARRKSA